MLGPLISTGSALSALSTSALLTPVLLPTSSFSTFTSTLWVTERVTSHVVVFYSPSEITLASTNSSVFSSVLSIPLSTNASTTASPSHLVTSTVVVTQTATSTVTASAPPSPPPLPSQFPSLSTSRTIWSAPAQMTDLSAFNVSSFTSGEHNLDIVTGIPASASDSASASSSSTATLISAASASEATSNVPATNWDNSSTVLQLLYPAHSINPGNHDRPQGGAQFYATPLPKIAEAKNVTLTYSVFFPADFEWVLAGKLPGLYGGREGCSGGDDALDCFSTRLMWRKGGLGELYLYARKDKQPDSLCDDPQSVCDAAYGFSIGRGSFQWTKGGWTTVQQCVTLNTPGEHDGSFTLDVNGERVIDRDDIFYRSSPPASDSDSDSGKQEFVYGLSAGEKPEGGLLGPLLRMLRRRSGFGYRRDSVVVAHQDLQGQKEWAVELPMTTSSELTRPTQAAPNSESPIVQEAVTEEGDRPIGFIGLFFSTFFGGHEPQYATPRDQYVWFKDFAISLNE